MKPSNSLNVYFDRGKTTMNQTINWMCDAGYEALDYNFWDWSVFDTPFTGDGYIKWLKEAKDVADNRGAYFNQAHATVYDFIDMTQRDIDQEKMAYRALEGCEILDIDWIVFHPVRKPYMSRSEFIDVNVAYFSKMLRNTSNYNVGIALENVQIYGIDEDMSALLEMANLLGDRAGICLDTGHALIQGLQQSEELIKIGSKLKAIHIQDNDGIHDQHICPFYGKCDWRDIAKGLKAISYTGDLTFEVTAFINILPPQMKQTALKLCIEAANTIKGYIDTAIV